MGIGTDWDRVHYVSSSISNVITMLSADNRRGQWKVSGWMAVSHESRKPGIHNVEQRLQLVWRGQWALLFASRALAGQVGVPAKRRGGVWAIDHVEPDRSVSLLPPLNKRGPRSLAIRQKKKYKKKSNSTSNWSSNPENGRKRTGVIYGVNSSRTRFISRHHATVS